MSKQSKVLSSVLSTAVNMAIDKAPVAVPQLEKDAIVRSVVKEAAPIVLHETNNEPWYQSRVTWGVLVASVATILKPISGELLDPGQTVDIVNALTSGGQLFGFGYSLYGRWLARKPIGS